MLLRTRLWAVALGAFVAGVFALSACGGAAVRSTPHPAPPPGERTSAAPVSTLAAYTVGDRRFSLVSFRDRGGAVCVTVDEGGTPGVPACAIALGGTLVNAAIASLGGGVIAVYGRVGDDVTQLEAATPPGRAANVPIYRDPRSGQRFFADLIAGRAGPQLTAVTPSGRQVLTDLNAKVAAFY
jgi:hypothetical protein